MRSDLRALQAFEERAFSTDRLSRRSFRRFVHSPTTSLIVAEANRVLQGYALVLFRSQSRIARLYSLAVDPDSRGYGIGSTLLAAAENAARRRGADTMRLEVRTDNLRAAILYRAHDYRDVGRVPGYYADGAQALRLEKPLAWSNEASVPSPATPKGVCPNPPA